MGVEAHPEGPVNLGNPGEFTIGELAEMVLLAIPSQARLVHKPLPVDDPQRRRPDISRAKQLLGWEPQVPLSKGLRPTIEWFAQHLAEREEKPARHRHIPSAAGTRSGVSPRLR
jgi:UDP-glucuronate decarboxylase